MRRADLSQAIARYLVQTKFPEGRAPDVRDADARREEIEGALVPLGGALHDHYFTSGDFDEVMIIDVPETVSAAACVMAALDGREVSGTVPLLALTEQAKAKIEQVDDGEAALRELWASLLEIRTLRASDPGIRMAAQDLYEPFRKELESRESLVIPWTAPDSEVPHVEAGTSSDGRPARLALRE